MQPSEKKTPRIWLASKSPRRQHLLQQIGIEFDLLLPDDPIGAEALEALRPGESPTQYVQRVTVAKLALAQQKHQHDQLDARPILAADTTVALGGTILGKPADNREAAQMMRALSGRTHRVLTAVAVARGSRVRKVLQVSRVRFARLSASDIEHYVALGESLDKAGGYAIQGAAARFVRSIQGSHSGIMGLPLYETARLIGSNA